MTETTFTSPRLERPREAALGGVCAALARTTGTEPVLWRVLFVVLSVFGGVGLALYLGACCVIPRQGQQYSLLERLLHGPDRRITTTQVLLLAAVVVATFFALHDNAGLVLVVGAAALAYMWWHRRHPVHSVPVPPADAAPTTPVPGTGVGVEPVQATAEGPSPDSRLEAQAGAAPVWQPPAPRPRSILTPLTLSTAAVAVGALLLVAAAGSVSIPSEVVLAVALGVVGLGLVASAFWGRARGLVPVAFLLAIALAGTFGARPAIDHGIGTRHWVAQATGADYRLGIGDATLILGDLLSHGGAARDVNAEVTVGHLAIDVPRAVHVIVDAQVQNGDIQGPGGVDASGRHVHKGFELGPRNAPPVYVHARVKLGMVEVRNA